MSVIKISKNAPIFIAKTTDVVNNSIPEITYIGAMVYLSDAKTWKIVLDDFTLADHVVNSDLEVKDIQIGAVEIKNNNTEDRLKINADGTADVNVKNALPTGTNKIGGVDIVTLPSLPTGTNKIGGVTIADGDSVAMGAKADSAVTDPTQSSSLIGGIKGIITYIKNVITANRVQVDISSIPSGNNRIGQTGYTLKRVSTSFTRPSDTTAYAVGDAVTNSTSSPAVFQLDLSSVGAVNGQSVEIRKLVVASSVKQSTLPLFNAYLSGTTFTATNDNSALDIDDTTMEAGGAFIQLDEQNYTASNSRVSKTNANCPMILASNDTKIYGTIQAANAYTPVSGEKFTIIAWVALL